MAKKKSRHLLRLPHLPLLRLLLKLLLLLPLRWLLLPLRLLMLPPRLLAPLVLLPAPPLVLLLTPPRPLLALPPVPPPTLPSRLLTLLLTLPRRPLKPLPRSKALIRGLAQRQSLIGIPGAALHKAHLVFLARRA